MFYITKTQEHITKSPQLIYDGENLYSLTIGGLVKSIKGSYGFLNDVTIDKKVYNIHKGLFVDKYGLILTDDKLKEAND